MRRFIVIAGVAATFHLPAFAICVNPFGCGPSNYAECIDDATKRPTELGVRVARQQCHEKFKKPEEDRVAAEQVKAAEKLAAAWRGIGDRESTLAGVKRALGAPDKTEGPAACAHFTDRSRATVLCTTYRWMDRRPGRICVQSRAGGIVTDDINCLFTLEVAIGTETIWAWWPESF
jgi:hypothetical protein